MQALAAAGAPGPETWNGDHPETWVANDLESVTLARYPELRGWLAKLSQAGARAQGMSGSGPTLFGLFHDREAAEAAERSYARHFSGWLAVARGLTRAEAAADLESLA